MRFNPKRRYGLDDGGKGSKGRIIVVAHTMQGWRKLKPNQREALMRLGFNLPQDPPREGEVAKLRALRIAVEEPESPQPPTRARVRWGRVVRELMYATGQWTRPDLTHVLQALAASQEEQERPAEHIPRRVRTSIPFRLHLTSPQIRVLISMMLESWPQG